MSRTKLKILICGALLCQGLAAAEQQLPEPPDRFHVRGKITLEGKPVAGVAVGIREINITTFTLADGTYDLYPVKRGKYDLAIVHPLARSETLAVFVKRDFVINRNLSRDVTILIAALAPVPFFSASSRSYDGGDTVAKAVSVFGLSPQYYTFLPSVSKMGVMFDPPVVRSQNPMNNAYVTEGLVLDMPFHSLGFYGTTNLRQVDSVSVARGVYSVIDRDAQGAALIETRLAAGKDGRNTFDVYANPLIADVTGHYQIRDKAWGSVSARRMIVDTYVTSKDMTIPAPIDYQTKNVYRLDKNNFLEVVAVGAHDSIQLTSTQTFGTKAHAQKVRYERHDGAFVYSLDLKNRYYKRDFVVLSEQKTITSLHPQVGYYFAKDQFAQAGIDLFYESRSAQLLQAQNIGDINLDVLKSYNTGGGYNPANSLNFGGFLHYRGRFGKAGAEASVRADKYREYDNLYTANALQLFYEPHPSTKVYLGGATMYKRPEPYKSISLLTSPTLTPESNYKAELGATYTPWKFLKLQGTVFYTRWNNVISLRTDTASVTDINNTTIFQNGGNSQNGGIETAAIFQYGNYYVRSSYTFQSMPVGDGYSYYYRRHIANAAFIYSPGRISHTVQLKVWSLPGDIENAKSDSLNPVVQLDYRFAIQTESGLFFMAEIGQILNGPWMFLANPRRFEYNDAAALGNSFLSAPNRSTNTPELPVHVNLAAGVRL